MSVHRTGMPAQICQRLRKCAQHCGFETAEQQRTHFLDAGEVSARLTVVGKEDDHRQSVHVRGAGRVQSNGPKNLRVIHTEVASSDQCPDRSMENYCGGRLSHRANQRVSVLSTSSSREDSGSSLAMSCSREATLAFSSDTPQKRASLTASVSTRSMCSRRFFGTRPATKSTRRALSCDVTDLRTIRVLQYMRQQMEVPGHRRRDPAATCHESGSMTGCRTG